MVNPRLAAALCAVVVLVCAAAPAVFLSVVDAASLGHSQAGLTAAVDFSLRKRSRIRAATAMPAMPRPIMIRNDQ